LASSFRVVTDHVPFIFRERRMGGQPERWLTVARSAQTTREDLGEWAEMASGDRLSVRRRTMWRHSRKTQIAVAGQKCSGQLPDYIGEHKATILMGSQEE
jgi:hypothetical protein